MVWACFCWIVWLATVSVSSTFASVEFDEFSVGRSDQFCPCSSEPEIFLSMHGLSKLFAVLYPAGSANMRHNEEQVLEL